MAIETELKLRIAPKDLERLRRHPFLRSISSGRAITRKLLSIYFDTPDMQLHRQKMALRLRKVGNQWIQTLKGGGAVQAGLHQRNEWESLVASEQIDFPAFESMGATHLPSALRNEVKPLFITDFSRSIRMVKFEGALVEIVLDSGEVRAGKSKHIISELELELKSGEPLQLFRLALALLDIVPLEIELVSKAEYGYRLLTPIIHSATKAKIPKLEGNIPVKFALQNLLWSCLFHLQVNMPGTSEPTNNEYLHQVRIALRRLRVVLNMTAHIRADDELEALSGIAAALGTELGRAREWDVFVTEILPFVLTKVGTSPGYQTLVSECDRQRKLNQQLAYTTLHTRDFQRLLLRFGAWMNGEYWKQFYCNDNLVNFAEEILHTFANKVRQRGEYVQQEAVTNKKLHKLRIACKSLRYCSELLRSLFGTARRTAQTKIVVKLQDTLGTLNDTAVAQLLLDELSRNVKLEIIAQIRNKIMAMHANQLKRLRKEWEQFRLGNSI